MATIDDLQTLADAASPADREGKLPTTLGIFTQNLVDAAEALRKNVALLEAQVAADRADLATCTRCGTAFAFAPIDFTTVDASVNNLIDQVTQEL